MISATANALFETSQNTNETAAVLTANSKRKAFSDLEHTAKRLQNRSSCDYDHKKLPAQFKRLAVF